MTAAVPAPRQSVSLGDATLRYLPDGTILLEAAKLYAGAGWDWSRHADLPDPDGLLIMSMGSFLIEIGGTRALVDLGLGDRRLDIAELSGGVARGEMVGGRLLAELATAGLTPDDIDVVLITHLHDEHLGWLVDAHRDELTFSRARHYLGRDEWMATTASGAPASPVGPTPRQVELLDAHADLLDDGDEPIPGVTAMSTPGHTPGHMSYVVSSAGERAIVIGDVVHSPVEFLAPDFDFVGDVDKPRSRRTRHAVLAELARPGTVAAGVHFPTDVFRRWDADTQSLAALRVSH